MEKKEKTSPLPGHNLFDPATLLGASPFSPGMAAALPFTHLAHLPGAFSMLGHPAFPVSSLFGHLGDGLTSPLGIPASLSSSLSPTSATSTSLSFDSLLSPILLSMGQGGPVSDPFSLIAPPTTKGDNSKFGSLFSLPSSLSTPTTTVSHSSSNKTTFSSSSATSTSSRSSFTNARGPGSRGGRGRGGGRRSSGRGRQRRLVKQPPIPLSLVQSTSILSPSMLEKYARKHLEKSSNNGFDNDTDSEKTSVSSLFDVNFDKDAGRSRNRTSMKSPTSPTSRSPSKTSSNGNLGYDDLATTSQDKVHIDSMKKKLIADQIRHRMQSKSPPTSTSSPSSSLMSSAAFANMSMGLSSRKRRGRPPKISSDECNLSPKQLEEETRIQERIRHELELELKQKETALKLITGKVNECLHGNKGKGKGRRSSKSPTKSADSSSTSVNGKVLTDDDDDHHDNDKLEDDIQDKLESDLEEGERLSKVKDRFHDLSGNVSSAAESNDPDLGSGASGSEMDNYTEDSDVDTGDDAATSGGKRKLDSNESGRPIKRRHVVLDDSKIQIPLGKGWKRQTNIHSYGRRGIVGEVWYFAPCGRKMKTIPDVMRYIERNNVSDLGRGHFSFNTKVNVGDFYEARVAGGENGFVKLTETEIQDRLSVTVSRRLKKIENQKKREKLKMQQIMARQMIENKMKQKIEQQEMARKVAEMQFQKRMQREQQKELLKRAKQLKILEKRKEREMERQQREEQLRMKQEMRAQQLMEKRRKKQAELQKKKYVKALKKAEEREMKRQQVAMLKEQMRMRQDQERRRQHMILLKALEQRKKQEEREKQKEEKIAERRLHRERKEEQRKMEFVLAQELKKPREDMELRDSRPLPDIPRIHGNHLDGESFADCLMSLEFMHNFAKPLGFDSESLPTLKSLQDAVSCKTEEDGEEYLSLVTHLLRYALDDPGVPNPKEAVTKLGQKITDLELTDVVLAEVLRVFMLVRNAGETPLSEYLRNYPLEACSIRQRAAVVAFLCNELNCSRMITTEIENHLDHMADIRRDKWIIEGKLRRLRTLRAKKFVGVKPVVGETESICEDSVMTSISKQSDDEDDKEDSGHEEEGFNEAETEEDDPTTLEDCEKQMEKLRKQHTQHRDKVFEESQHVRAIDLGRDRYKRNYWVLPHVGGLFLEGMESGEIKDIVMVKLRSERSESRSSMKVEVIGEKTEKKAVEFLEDIPEKKASEILRMKEENKDLKKEIVEKAKKGLFGDGKQINGLVKLENEVIAKSKCELVVKTEEEDGEKIVNGELVKSEYMKEEIRNESGIFEVMKPVCNGDIGVQRGVSNLDSDTKPPHGNNYVSGNEETLKSPTKHVELKIPNIKASAIEEARSECQANQNLFLQVPKSTKLSEFCSMSIDAALKTDQSEIDHQNHHQSSSHHPTSTLTSSLFSNTSFTDHVTKSSTNHKPPLSSPPCPPPAHSKTQIPERKSSFMSIDSILEKTPTSSQSNQYNYQTSSLPVNPFVSQPLRMISESPVVDSRPWFSLLPRVPCDDMSLTRGQHSTGMLLSPPFISQLPFQPFSLQSPAFASFQMSQLFNNMNNFSGTNSIASTSMTVTQSNNDLSFKKPEPVNSSQNTNTKEVLKTLQGEAKPIPEEYKCGWWKISDSAQVGELQQCLHPRGIRERNLQKMIQKFQEYAEASCTVGKDVVLCMESSSEEEVTDDEEEQNENSADNSAGDKTDTTENSTCSEQSDKHIANNGGKGPDAECEIESVFAHEGSKTVSENETNDANNSDCAETSTDDQNTEKNDNSDENGCESNMEINGTSETHNENEKSTEDGSDDNKGKDSEHGQGEKKADIPKSGGKKGRGRKPSKIVKKKTKKVKKPPPTIDCKARSDEADRLILEEVEALEDRIATASLQIKGWKLAPKTFSDESEIRIIARGEPKKDENDCYPLEAAKERLLQLELNVERRYLKPPLSKAHRISLNSMSSSNQQQQQQQQQQENCDDADSEVDFENLPIGLQMWRIAVATATSPAQLMLCVIQLNKAISWEKSIMKVLCQICRKDDNEAELLLCDGCDRGYHTYCFKPKMENVPEGDWYCFECVAKVVGESCCLVCGRRLGKMAECNSCNRCVHIDCVDPPLPRVPRKWFCAACADMKGPSAKKRIHKNSTTSMTSTAPSTPVPDLTPTGRKRRSDFGVPRKRKSSDSTMDGDSPQKGKEDTEKLSEKKGGNSPVNTGEVVVSNSKAEKQADKEKFKLQEQSSDLRICRSILTEMMKHEDGWPFLQPVNCKHFPSYRKYIKSPMDFGTMKIKLRDHIYQLRSEFYSDAILVFDNCQLFNEDDSEVGQCGHNMREFFTRRWKEIIFEAMTETVC